MTFLPKRDHNSILAIHSQLVKNSLITNYFHLLCNVICLCRHTQGHSLHKLKCQEMKAIELTPLIVGGGI